MAKNCFERDATTGLDKKRSFTEKKSCKIWKKQLFEKNIEVVSFFLNSSNQLGELK